jgi:uncharacterized protein (TIGR01244 family)
MQIRELQPGYAVSPQIETSDMAALAAAGFGTVINNRPDAENPAERHAGAMRAAAAAVGLTFVDNPISPGQITLRNVEIQREAIDAAGAPVFAYCASGNRSSIVWAFAQAGRHDTDVLIAAAAKWGYALEQFRRQIDSLARG